MASREVLWPELETGYEDEFGAIDPELHCLARKLWPRAEQFAIAVVHDPVVGYRLLMRAVAAVSGLPSDKRGLIRDPSAYLFQTYKRLVVAELEKQNSHHARDREAEEQRHSLTVDANRIERDLLIAELVRVMDSWTREVFEDLVLGYSFKEIGSALGSNPHVVRNRFRLALRRLGVMVSSASEGQRGSVPGGAPTAVPQPARPRTMRTRLLDPSRWVGRPRPDGKP